MIPRLTVCSRIAVVALSLLLAPLGAVASSQDAQYPEFKYKDGRFLETVGGVIIQRADEVSSDEAVLNMPFLPGDRVWTDDLGRAEIVFAQGEVLWIAERSKVDSLGRGGRDQDERLGLRAFAGSFAARVRPGGPGFEFRAPGGTITTTGAALFRVDVRAFGTVVSVSEGEILVEFADQRMTLRSGERVRYEEGAVDGPFGYDRADGDRFERWFEERATQMSSAGDNHDRLPDELDGYGDELDRNGDWVYDDPQGYVYVPRVAYGWAPFTYGRWVYTFYGWTWVASEPWGFVTSHYGRWGYSARIGWHWMPRTGFSGAWVGWSSPLGRWDHTIGWCALGFNDRPVGSFAYGSGGRAVSRVDSGSTGVGRGWSFTNRADMGRPNASSHRVTLPADEAARASVWNQGASPDRQFRASGRGLEARRDRDSAPGESTRDATRGEGRFGGDTDSGERIYVRPSPGDSTPELQSDPTTTIPSPESRRRRTIGKDGFKDEQDAGKSRARDDSNLRLEGTAATPAADSRAPANDRGTAESPQPPRKEPAPAENNRETKTRDPLLNRFFRSITRPDSRNPGSRNPDSRDPGSRDPGSRDADSRDPDSRDPNSRDPGSRDPDSRDKEAASPRGNGAAVRRNDPAARDDSSARENDRRERERPRPPDARPAEPKSRGENRERARPSGGERSEPRTRTPPPPQASPSAGGSDERATRRKPRQEG